MDSITFMSYNSTGIDSNKIYFMNDIYDEYDIDFLAIQEHFRFVNVDKFFEKGFDKFSNFVQLGYRAVSYTHLTLPTNREV